MAMALGPDQLSIERCSVCPCRPRLHAAIGQDVWVQVLAPVSPGAVWGTLVLIDGALFIAVTEVEARRPASYGTTTIRPTA